VTKTRKARGWLALGIVVVVCAIGSTLVLLTRPTPVTPVSLCRSTLHQKVYSARFVTVAWIRDFTEGPSVGADRPVRFPHSAPTDEAAWCWTRAPDSWLFWGVDTHGHGDRLAGLGEVGSMPAPTDPPVIP
jgi:hypothetical protein